MGIVLVILVSVIAGIAKSICDTLLFRYGAILFKIYDNGTKEIILER